MGVNPEFCLSKKSIMSLPSVQSRNVETKEGFTHLPFYLVRILSMATFLVFVQGFMVAPILPHLSLIFRVSVQYTSFIEPSYLLGYGSVTLIYASVSDRYGRFPVILFSLCCFIALTFFTGFVHSADQMIVLRLLTGLGAGGIAPTTIGWIGDQFPYEKRGHALGIFFGCMAGGTAFGSFAGALLEPVIGWRGLFFLVAGLGFVILFLILYYQKYFRLQKEDSKDSFSVLFGAIKEIMSLARSWRTYLYVMFNGMFHSGVFTWLGYLFFKSFHLGETGIGLALLGYGIPGFLLGPIIGKMADRYGRNKIIPIGLLSGGVSAVLLGLNLPLVTSNLLVATLSLGFDMTHPLFAAITTTFSPKKGASTGLFAFFLFMGYGLGSLLFSLIVKSGLNQTFILFGGAALLAAFLSVWVFRNEK
ncbi:MAG: major facilitator superfamily 1 [Mucilaginibacter sp.]|nr:major facilitator superfamily 1 [Mucilaginibacter sp.]